MTRRRSDDSRLRVGWEAAVPDHVIAVAWRPDGRHVAAASVGGPVRVFAAADGRPVAELTGHSFGTAAVAWSPTGERLATAGQDGKLRVWDTALWQERAALPGGAAWVEHLAFHPNGLLLASAAGKSVRIWDAAGDLVREWAGHKATVSGLAWRPGADHLAVGVYGGVLVYTPTSADPVVSFPWTGAPLCVAWSPDGRTLAHGNQDATVHFRTPDRPADPLRMGGYPAKVRHLSWDYSSRYLATGGGDSACVWDCGGTGPRGTKPLILAGHGGPLTAVAYQRRGFLLASGGPEGRVNLFQPANKKGPLVGQVALTDGVSALAWGPDDRHLLAGAADGGVVMLKVS